MADAFCARVVTHVHTRSKRWTWAGWSTNGETWTRLGNVSIPMSDAAFIGLPVTSHHTGATAAAVFDDVRITPF
jgi:hypothetical protein